MNSGSVRQFFARRLVCLSALATWLAAFPSANPAASPPLEPVFRLRFAEGKQRFATRHEIDPARLRAQVEDVAFLAVVTNQWLQGLVPVFLVEKPDRIELRRRPARGEENSSEPLFFALPPEDEPDATQIAGFWECQATRGDSSKVRLGWELAVEQEKVSGRFDPNTEYRVAYIVGGTFRSNRLELRVEHVNDAYELIGEWREDKLRGRWRRIDDSENGTWEATQPEGSIPSSHELAALHEWRLVSDEARRYTLDGESPGPGWERAPRPLCRVWRSSVQK